jgi:hypothetical protein
LLDAGADRRSVNPDGLDLGSLVRDEEILELLGR